MICRHVRCLLIFVALVISSASHLMAQSGPVITLAVDATQAPEKVIRARMAMPTRPGPLTLYYPKWIPGEHEPSGPIGNVTGLKFSANGRTIPWRRDLLDVFTFHLDVPEGAHTLEAEFAYLEPTAGVFSAGASATDKLLVLSWNQELLYPAGFHADQITFQPSLRLPEGWKYGTPLPVEAVSGNQITFKPVTLNRLVDSPVLAGEFYRAVDVTPQSGEPMHHEIDMVADSAAALEMSPELQKKFTNLVTESGKLFGSRHYRDYHFLLTLSDHVAHFGLEHHESNDSRTGERALLTPQGQRDVGRLLSHEFVHSWNGKFRRPADLSTPEFETPMRTDLLWVYEGLTDFLGPLLAARSELLTAEQYRDHLAANAAELGPGRPGRTWRPLQDTADAIPGMFGGFGGQVNWKRGADYYREGDLLWLEVSMIIQRESRGKKSIEDFCRAFHGGPNNGPELRTYTFDDLVRALNDVVPYNWAHSLHERLISTSPDAPVGGIDIGGWKVEFNDKPLEMGGGRGRLSGGVDARYSIGLTLGGDGSVADSIWGGLAFQAGILPGMRIVAINDRAFTTDGLHDVLKASKTTPQSIRFLVVNNDYYSTHTVNYEGGEKYPHLVRAEGKPDLLDDLSKPLARPRE